MAFRPLPPPPVSTAPPTLGLPPTPIHAGRRRRPLPPPPTGLASSRPAWRPPRPQRWHGYLLLGLLALVAAWHRLPGLWLEIFYRRPTAEWARAEGQENLRQMLGMGGKRPLDFEVRETEILRVEPGVAEVSLRGVATLRESLYQTLDWQQVVAEAGADLPAFLAASAQSRVLRWPSANQPSVPDCSNPLFLKERAPAGKVAPFNLSFRAVRRGVRWNFSGILNTQLTPTDAFPGVTRSQAAAQSFTPALPLESEEGRRRIAEISALIQRYVATVNAQRTLEGAGAPQVRPPADPIAEGLWPYGQTPTGFVIPRRTVSSGGHFGVLAPDWEHFDEDRSPQNQLVEINSGRVLAALAPPTWVENRANASERRVRNHMSLDCRWSADGSVLAWVLGGKWFPSKYLLLRVRDGQADWQVDVLQSVQREILRRTETAVPRQYAAAVRQNQGNSGDYPDGFTISADTPGPNFTLPFRTHVTLVSNPKEIAGWPPDAEVRASLEATLQVDGTLTYDGFAVQTGPRGSPLLAPRQAFRGPMVVPAAPAAALPGERYPETRTRLLRPEDLRGWNAAKLRYAINEMYARRGADFRDKDLHQWFTRLPWYQPQPGLGPAAAEAAFSPLEAENLKVLGAARDTLK